MTFPPLWPPKSPTEAGYLGYPQLFFKTHQHFREWGGGGRTSRGVMERLRAGLNGSEWVGWSYVFYPVTPGTSGRCRGGKERPARPPPASSHESHVLDNAPAAAREPPPPSSGPQVSAAACPRRGGGSAAWVLPSRVGGAEAGRARGAGGGGQGGMQLFILKLDVFSSEGEILQWDWLENRSSFMIMIGSA